MSNLHKKLKSLRRERKIDLEAIEKRTKIDIKYLKAIENGKFEILPSTYIRLFLKAYCVEIGADPIDALYQLDELINNGKKSNNSDEEILPIIDINEDIDESSKIESSKSPYKKKSEWLKGFSMILLLLFSIYIIKKIVSSDENLSVAKNINETSNLNPITDFELINDFILDKTNSGSLDVDPPYMAKIISRKNDIWMRTETDSSLPIENILNSSNQDNFSFVKRFELLVNPAKDIDIFWNGQLIPYLESTKHPAKINLNGINRTITIQYFVPQN
ncbi:MAG: helix-turn-helix transcriptional regulator [Candidatus Neomarinimicrobiota bacterium]|nr:helix-turn-helix transcriptional regulator [Candidatus Neomarinimicrobiota bacterium]